MKDHYKLSKKMDGITFLVFFATEENGEKFINIFI